MRVIMEKMLKNFISMKLLAPPIPITNQVTSTPMQNFLMLIYSRQINNASRQEPEYDLKDTLVLDQGWFEVSVEYVKTTENETLIQYTIQNKGKSAELTFIPQIW